MQPKTPWYRILYVQVLLAVALGILVGAIWPEPAQGLEVLGKAFIALVKMLIAPVVFCTVVHGIASMRDMKKLGRVGWKALLYFELVSTLALFIGLGVVNAMQPGKGFMAPGQEFHATAKQLEEVAKYTGKSVDISFSHIALSTIPDTLVSAFTSGNLLQVLLVSILAAFALVGMGDRGERIIHGIDTAAELFFGIMKIVVKAAPIGAFGAMAFTVGKFGVGSLAKLGALMGGFYVTAFLFVAIVLGLIARVCGFSVFRFIAYIKEELMLVLGTSSSETALPGLMTKLQRLGCNKTTVGLVVPTGYSFNLDGTNIYMAMAAIFLAQATNHPMTFGQQIGLMLIAMITSKGASGVTGAGFIALAATLQSVPDFPVASMAILVGIDRFMSECRALTNLVGNGVATLVISRWEGEVTGEQLSTALAPAKPA